MYRRRSKRTQRFFFFLTYTVAPLLIVGSVAVLVLFIQGYRFNTTSGDVFQAGLVQFGTRPSGATVKVDGSPLAARTRTRINVSDGIRTITMTRNGYVPWEKTVEVVPGSVLWLTYARLVPTEVTTENLYDYETAATVLTSNGRNLFGIQPAATEPTFETIPATDSTPTRTSATVPESLYEVSANQTFTATEWGESGRYVLFRHDVGAKHAWLMLDTSDATKSINISDKTGLTISKAFFDAADDRYVYLQTNGSLVRFDRSSLTTSAVLAKNVQSITQSTDGVVMVVAQSSEGKMALSYITSQADTARQITFADADDVGVIQSAVVVTYDRHEYIGVLSGGELIISRTGVDSSETTAPLQLTPLVTLKVAGTITRLEPSPNGRFVALVGTDRVSMYDLEIEKLSPLVAQYTKTPALRWLDEYHLIDRRDDMLSMFEFDGANRTAITNVASQYSSVLTSSGTYVYVLQQDHTGYHVVRAQLLD